MHFIVQKELQRARVYNALASGKGNRKFLFQLKCLKIAGCERKIHI
jgi:hypothetical protein